MGWILASAVIVVGALVGGAERLYPDALMKAKSVAPPARMRRIAPMLAVWPAPLVSCVT